MLLTPKTQNVNVNHYSYQNLWIFISITECLYDLRGRMVVNLPEGEGVSGYNNTFSSRMRIYSSFPYAVYVKYHHVLYQKAHHKSMD